MVIKRNYVIPLRKEFQKSPKYRRSNKAVKGVVDFLSKHMKSDNIKVGKHLNEKIWENGIKNPPGKVEVVAIKGDDGLVKVELVGFEKEIEDKPAKTEKKSAKTDVKSDDKKEEATESLEKSVATDVKEEPKAKTTSKKE